MGWHDVAALEDLPEGGMKQVVVADEDILLVRLADRVCALSDLCTHAHVNLSGGWMEGEVICCPMHGGKFDARTGKAVQFPAFSPLRTFEVREQGGRLSVCVDD
jgi:3-phenylpropionate/trans-cinnamate dioxygenase ferredoxin subunit